MGGGGGGGIRGRKEQEEEVEKVEENTLEKRNITWTSVRKESAFLSS